MALLNTFFWKHHVSISFFRLQGENDILTIICKKCPCCNKLAYPDDLDYVRKMVISDRPFFTRLTHLDYVDHLQKMLLRPSVL